MTNRLAETQSLYLRKHAENPIDWWSWCEEALATARRENKPIFLSIGYSSCHWCTVMEGEAFSDEAIAHYLNTNFLPIKVDREERPDLDSIYMQALQMMTGQGGWPLNIFLTPDDLVPFYGGTYFPVDPRYGRPGFMELLQAIRRFYDLEKDKLQAFKSEVLNNLQQSAILSISPSTLNPELLHQGVITSTGIITPNDSETSFPMIPYAELALRGLRLELKSRYDGKQACIQRGLDLVLGGIYDHVGGGFHRYTVDPNWTVPHFEKMLYDNGQIIEYLANLWSAGVEEPAFERAIAKTVQWLKREMTSPQGYFYAAQDADNFVNSEAIEPEEGDFYVWLYSQLEQLLTEAEISELKEHFYITEKGNFEGAIVLKRRHPGKLSDTIETALNKLFAARYGTDQIELFPPARNNQEAKTGNWLGRIPPVTDTKMIVAWNSLTISGLARASVVFQQPEYLELAQKTATFILDNQWVDGRLYRLNYDGSPTVLAQSEDYALLIKALLDLHQASPEIQDPNSPYFFWLEKAIATQDEFDEYLWSVELGGYYNTSSNEGKELLVRERSYIDNATPSANGIAIANLVRLALLTEDLQYLTRAEQALQVFSGVMQSSPQAVPSLFNALDWYLNGISVKTGRENLSSLITQYFPTAIISETQSLPSESVGLVCHGFTCKEPAKTYEQMLEQIAEVGMG